MAIKGDQVTMKDGKVMLIRDGKMIRMEEELTLSNGTRIMPNGQMIMADGAARMMQEGETMTVDHQETAEAEELSESQFKEAMEDEELRDELH